MSGKAKKEQANKKAVMNEEIEALVMKYYITYAEMPQYVANLGDGVKKQFDSHLAMMATHIGLLTANMKKMEKSVKDSKLPLKSKNDILKWVEMFKGKE